MFVSTQVPSSNIQVFALLPTSLAHKSIMKLSSLLLVPSLLVAPVIAGRSTAEWVGDVKSITDEYQKTQAAVKNTKSGGGNHGEFFFLSNSLRRSDVKVSAAVSQQQKASADNGAEGEVSLTFPLYIHAC